MPSLLRDEAITRKDLLRVDGYDVDVDLTGGDETFRTCTTIRFGCHRPGASTFVEVVPKRLLRAELNGRRLPDNALAGGRLVLSDLAAENVLVVDADMEYSRSGEGLHRFTDPEDGLTYVYMMGFLDMASRVFACFEQPDLKAPYRLSVTADPSWTVTANETGAQTQAGRWEFLPTQPLSTYFVTFVAGPFRSVYREYDGVRFGLHARQSYGPALETDVEELFEVTFGVWDRLHELYGVRYPFGESYDQVFVPEFNAAAMENPGCVTFRDQKYLFRSEATERMREERAITIAHEMAHMWFGDLVTTNWWDDLWLNESFADCMGLRATVEGTRFCAANGGEAFKATSGIAADQRRSTHPVAADVPASGEALNNFDGISYAKGGAILTQLNAWLGDEAFFAGLREYFARHRFGNASLSDLMDCLAASSGRDLTGWAQRWLQTTGPNTLRLNVTSDGDRYTTATVTQSADPEHPTLRPHRVRLGVYELDGGVARLVRRIPVEIDGADHEVGELVGERKADLLLLDEGGLTFAKIRLDHQSLTALPRVLPALEDAFARSQLWNIVNDMVRDGEMTVPDFLELTAAALPGETKVPQLEGQFEFLFETADAFVPLKHRPAVLRQVVMLAHGIRIAAAPGSGVQSCALRQEIRGSVDVTWLRALLSGQAPDGVVVDAELRWATLLRLVVLGEAARDDIDAELCRDGSSHGHEHAATCRAALPVSEAKAEAWQAIMSDTTLSNALLCSTAAGFWWPEQSELTSAYVSRFFDEAPKGIGSRSPWEAAALARRMFPRPADRDVFARAEKLLRRDDLAPQFRRAVSDRTDDLDRALRVRGD